MKRYFFSDNYSCQAECLYCFAKWESNYQKHPIFDINMVTEKDVVIYPCCNSEITPQNITTFLHTIEKDINRFNSLYISLSYKNNIDSYIIKLLSDFNNSLIALDKGFIKVSLSIATKKQIDLIEKGCSQYQERLDLLKILQDEGLKTAVTLKPILPFIPLEEYTEIISETMFSGKYLLGDLYVNQSSYFFNKYIKNNFQLKTRHVNWLNTKNTFWDYVADIKKTIDIKKAIKHLGLYYFDSDIDVIKSFIEAGS